jgi:hypothetical protein
MTSPAVNPPVPKASVLLPLRLAVEFPAVCKPEGIPLPRAPPAHA